MDQIQVALSARVSKPTGIVSGEVPVWNGTTWVRSSVTGVTPSGIAGYPTDGTKFLAGDGTWKGATNQGTKKRPMVPIVFTTSGTAVADVQNILQYQYSATLTCLIGFEIVYPDNYVSGDFTVKFLLRSNTTDANTAVLRKFSYRFRDSAAFSMIDNSVNVNITGWTSGNDVTLSATVLAANYAAGDVIRVDIQRLGADAGDTHAGVITVDGCWIEYLGS